MQPFQQRETTVRTPVIHGDDFVLLAQPLQNLFQPRIKRFYATLFIVYGDNYREIQLIFDHFLRSTPFSRPCLLIPGSSDYIIYPRLSNSKQVLTSVPALHMQTSGAFHSANT